MMEKKVFLYDQNGITLLNNIHLIVPFDISNATLEQQYTGTSNKTLRQLTGDEVVQ